MTLHSNDLILKHFCWCYTYLSSPQDPLGPTVGSFSFPQEQRDRGMFQPTISIPWFLNRWVPFLLCCGSAWDCSYTFSYHHLLFSPYSQGRCEIFPQHPWPQGAVCPTGMAWGYHPLPPDSTHRVEAQMGCHVCPSFHRQTHHIDVLNWGWHTSMPMHSWLNFGVGNMNLVI